MSAMAGTRSPTSPWPQERQSLQPEGSSTATALFPLCDPHQSPLGPISSQNTCPESPGHNYFSISVENPSNAVRVCETLPYAQPPASSPKAHIPKNKASEECVGSPRTGPGAGDAHSDSTTIKLSWNPGLQRRGLMPSRLDASLLQPVSANGCAVSAEHCAKLLETSYHETMFLDVRPYAHFTKGTIKGSLNLCIPTTLLKRPSFDTQKLANTFTDEFDRTSFARWKHCRYIIVFDSATRDMKDASSLVNVLKKFTAEGWNGEGLILLGGFTAFSSRFPSLTQEQRPPPSASELSSKNLSRMHIDLPSVAPVVGGCALPESSHATIPFFGNIRQNMDLIGGVGQIPLQLPPNLSGFKRGLLPSWLREVSEAADKGRKVSERFLALEKKELERMKLALSYKKSTDQTIIGCPTENFRVAGIEKGTKNRYNDIYPFEHSRVRLQNVPPGGCDYVNANHMKSDYSGKCYIATQAPVPDTFTDFWRVVWDQDVRLIVSLTAEVERGHVKCHPYWESGDYGPCLVNNFSQRYIHLGSHDPQLSEIEPEKSEESGNPYIIVRHFGLYSSERLFQLLVKYAFQQLYGSQFHSTYLAFDFGNYELDVKACSFSSWSTQTLAIVGRGQEKVHLFRIRRGRLQAICQISPSWDQPGAAETLKTAFDGDDGVHILRRFIPALDGNDTNARHPFVRQAMQSNSKGMFYLSQHSLRSPDEPVRICAFPDHVEYEPLALAVAHGSTFAISWRHVRDHSEYEVVLYSALTESKSSPKPGVVGSFSQSGFIRDRSYHEQGPVMELAFNDRSSQLLYRYRAQTLYSSFQNIDASIFPIQPTLYRNSCPVQFTDSLNLLFSIGIPFHGTHETRVQNGVPRCHFKYLAFGMATHREEGWTVACLLRSSAVCRASNCEHILQLERGRRLPDWTIVARLWGFQNPNNSLGCKVAAAGHGTRIAVANWNTVYIWALEPNALIEKNASGFYPASSWPAGSEMIELRPIVLSLEAVCFQLYFAENENELVALTDQGLMYWDISPTGRGNRITYEACIDMSLGSKCLLAKKIDES
ncbi:hypothetical protein BO70DRAFT_375153 [Aspergillus heteromorphus CBS 117.55]|uniref:Uncharacterized protein n=1 Tax=Aspergillus heteromorphus CBS 117.55 TaxID=1448321 RepID=A0A317UVL6_9EURO|nr:uncharacterized protein BO70DRAFT_375153 [Aspergillus heteromorphus CBS 117.55]PWY64512.1 hypothetical protein BO70DRAFT_375153 [Aspergillus heteromorphus CBS 117.55]